MKQSIVTWHKWPDNGVEGLPGGKPMIVITHNGNTGNRYLWKIHGRLLVVATGEPVLEECFEHFAHYALASDLETVHEIDGDKCGILPRALIDRARASKPTIEDSSIVQKEDRVRWLALMRAIWFGLKNTGALEFEEWAQDFEHLARAQVERERKESGHE